jgi:hypothetical protein
MESVSIFNYKLRMSNTNGGGSGNWRNEHVSSAHHYTRKVDGTSGSKASSSGSSASSGPSGSFGSSSLSGSLGSSSSAAVGGTHYGVVVDTTEGNSYLIHSGLDYGVVRKFFYINSDFDIAKLYFGQC